MAQAAIAVDQHGRGRVDDDRGLSRAVDSAVSKAREIHVEEHDAVRVEPAPVRVDQPCGGRRCSGLGDAGAGQHRLDPRPEGVPRDIHA
jgi:hypothetical protein